jgi:uncharacterized protein YndB with AHSA1/START domain
MSDRFVYVTYIRTTPEKLWDALTTPEFTKQYWFGITLEGGAWKKGSAWQMKWADGRVNTSGEVLESERPRRLVLSWRSEHDPEMKAEGTARASFDIEPVDREACDAGEQRFLDTVKLTITHEIDRDRSKTIRAVSGGWPLVLASLKSFLETGEPIQDPRRQACG